MSRLDHDANVRPWVQAAEAVGATVRWVDFDPARPSCGAEHLEAVLSERTRLVALTAASNVLGTRPDVPALAALGPRRRRAAVRRRGAPRRPRAPRPDRRSGADFYACSPYKFGGPHCGMVAADPALLEDAASRQAAALDRPGARAVRARHAPLRADGRRHRRRRLPGLPRPGRQRWPARAIVGAYAAVEAHEDRLRDRIEPALAGRADVTLWSRAPERTSTLYFSLTASTRSTATPSWVGAAGQHLVGPLLRVGALPAARAGRHRRDPGRAGALLRRRRRRPAARGCRRSAPDPPPWPGTWAGWATRA